MWWIKGNSDSSRGGFQDRDIGKNHHDYDFGPEFGVDYARYSDAPDLKKDLGLCEKIKSSLLADFSQEASQIEVSVKNGFVILKGEISSPEIRKLISEKISWFPEVKDIISELNGPSATRSQN